jgi:hypothetical protein
MTRYSPHLRVAGIALSALGLALAACAPATPNLAAETPFVPPTVTGAPLSTPLPPTATTPPEAYPASTEAPLLPDASSTPGNYPVDGQPTADLATAPPAASATLAPVFITYRDFEIVPAVNTARVGQQVIFLIESASGAFHQPYAGASAPFIFEAPPNMGNGVSWPITFNNAQTLTILCGYHGNMTATLVIAP